MAKMTTCPMCGKEMKAGFFSGEGQTLYVGDDLLTVCDDCHKEYAPTEKVYKKRFATKMSSLRYASRTKPNKAQIAQMYKKYVQEAKEYAAKDEGAVGEYIIGGFAKVTADGRFSVMEVSNDLLGRDVDAKAMVKTLNKMAGSEDHWFTKEDITKIEFAYNDNGSFLGLFHKAYAYTVRLNDEKVMTFRPAITRTAALGSGFALGYRKKADRVVIENLEAFRQAIGSTLPITRGNSR